MSDVNECKRFVPKAEKSVLCRHCGEQWYNHKQDARHFDSVIEMHYGYMTNFEIRKWLLTLGTKLSDQYKRVNAIIASGQDPPGSPDLTTLKAVAGVLQQLVIQEELERREKAGLSTHCSQCNQPLELSEEKVCFQCSSMATEGEVVGNVHEGTPSTLLPHHDFD